MIVSCPSCQRNYVVADEQIAGKQFRARCKSCGVEFHLDGMLPPRDTGSAASKDEPAKFMSATEAFLSLRTAPPSSLGKWSVCLSKTDTRRLATEEVVSAYAKGTFGTNVLVWRTGMPQWLKLSEVPELMAALGKPLSKAPTAATETAAATSKAEPQVRGSVAPGGRPSKPATARGRTATLLGTGVPSVKPVSIPARSNQTSPPPGEDGVAVDLKRAALASPGVPNFDAPPPIPDSVGSSRSVPPRPTRALEIPVEVEISLPESPTAPADTSGSASAEAKKWAATPGDDVARPGGEPNSSAESSDSAQSGLAEPVGLKSQADEGTSGIMLPPLKGAVTAVAAGSSIAAAASLARARHESSAGATKSVRPKVAIGSNRELDAGRDSSLGVAGSSRGRSTSTSDRDSVPPRRDRRRVAGMVVAMSAMGIVGVLGGVAGAVYVMRTAGVELPAGSVVALQPQPATPIPSGHPTPPMPAEGASRAELSTAAAPSIAVPDASAVASTNVGTVSERPRSVLHASRAVTSPQVTPAKASAKPPSQGAETQAPVATGVSAPAPAVTTPAAAGTAPFNRDSAMAVLGLAASRVPTCRKADGAKGTSKVQVTFDPSGAVVAANVAGAPLAGTAAAQCISAIFRKVRVPPFAGERVTIAKDVTIPP